MKNLKQFGKVMFVLFALLIGVSAQGQVQTLNIGDKAPLVDVKMKDVSGKEVSVSDAKKENGVLVLFSCNTCPFVLRWENRYNELKEWADANKVGMIVLNSNELKRDGDDSFEKMQEKAAKMGYKFYYVVDTDSKLANAFGAKTTPHAFLLDKDLKLVYKGAIDDNSKSAKEVQQAYVKDAISSLGKGISVAVPETSPVGCGIKRKVQ